MNRDLALDFVRVTEAAALAVAPLIGKGNKDAVDKAGVDAMRSVFNNISINGRVAIGEGERDKAPMLYIGEELGIGGEYNLDIAVDPVEGTILAAKGLPNSLAVVAAVKRGKILGAPDMYMKKIAVGEGAKGAIDLNASPSENLKSVAKALGKEVSDLTAIILDRFRHREIIKEVREAGAKVKLINAGDIIGGISTALSYMEGDILLGVGGAPEGVVTAAALKCLGGEMQAQLLASNESEKKRALEMGIDDLKRVLTTDDLVQGDDIVVSMTGITNGELLKGVKCHKGVVKAHSILIRSSVEEGKNIREFNQLNTEMSSQLKVS
ncbi:class II fructose-bisphosphatase [Halonatronum saccharophilum]|uniref:class II fructose-bisphosphatase n=1 Tax=Halonatronum saccharophilum TaxID=150060 RepID=UPI0004BB6F54|nr:class II fructose-bisphosphatase [Halonatronum saccharophilum]